MREVDVRKYAPESVLLRNVRVKVELEGREVVELRDFVVSGELDVDTMILLLDAEAALNSAEGSEAIRATMTDAKAHVEAIIREHNPDAPPLKVNLTELLGIMGALAGDDTVADAVAATVAPGHDREEGEPAARPAEDVELEGGDPLASLERSSSLSSGSGDTTAGSLPTGGPDVLESAVSPGISSARI